MDAEIRPLRSIDEPAATRLLDDAVGPGFWSFGAGDRKLSFVAVTRDGLAGVLIARLVAAGDPDARTALGPPPTRPAEGGDTVLHVRELAVSPHARRAGLASRLLSRAEAEAAAGGARAAFAFGWLPAGRPEPDAVPFYEAAGYAAGADLADFFAESSVAAGARCPYCGDPPCRCAVRPFVKRLRAPAA